MAHHVAPSLEDSVLIGYLGPRDLQKGRDYFNEKWRISNVSAKENNSHLDVLGYVIGGQPTPYEVWLVFSGGVISQTSCSCPAASDGKCKHVACMLLHFRENDIPRTSLTVLQSRPEKKDRFPKSHQNAPQNFPAFPDSSPNPTQDPSENLRQLSTPEKPKKREKPGFSLGAWNGSAKKDSAKKKFHLSAAPVDLSPTKLSCPQIITPIDPEADLPTELFQMKFRCFAYVWWNLALRKRNRALTQRNQQQSKTIQDLQTQIAFLKTQHLPTKSHVGNRLIGSYETTSLKFSCSVPEKNPLKKRKINSDSKSVPTKRPQQEVPHAAAPTTAPRSHLVEPNLKRKHGQIRPLPIQPFEPKDKASDSMQIETKSDKDNQMQVEQSATGGPLPLSPTPGQLTPPIRLSPTRISPKTIVVNVYKGNQTNMSPPRNLSPKSSMQPPPLPVVNQEPPQPKSSTPPNEEQNDTQEITTSPGGPVPPPMKRGSDIDPLVRDGAKVLPLPPYLVALSKSAEIAMEIEKQDQPKMELEKPKEATVPIPTKSEAEMDYEDSPVLCPKQPTSFHFTSTIATQKDLPPPAPIPQTQATFPQPATQLQTQTEPTQASTQTIMNLCAVQPTQFAQQVANRARKSGISNDVINETLLNMKSLFAKHDIPVDFTTKPAPK